MNAERSQPAYLRQAVDCLQAALGNNLLGVILYGSHARGEPREGSDVDLFVIARNLPARRYERAARLHRLLREIEDAPSFSVLGKTPEEFERYFPSLYLDLGLDGVVLFDRDGYTAERLGRIRQIIAQAGLFREQDNGNMYWNWKKPPRRHWEITWEGYRDIA
ncbi:MAG: nucleotidyltransferase domain-containing protein [Chloroflexi bacterium]|nr:nucleotidyltransferase domain-containing protein [Chloroflexota bacterium]